MCFYRPFVNLGIGTTALELALELELELIQQTQLFLFSQGLSTPNLAGWWLRMRGSTTWSCDKSKTLYLHIRKAYGPQT